MKDRGVTPQVGVIMGSSSDWDIMQHTAKILQSLAVSFESKVVSAHRTPDLLCSYAQQAADRGLKCIIAGAGGAAHLPGMVSAMTQLPVLGVPMPSHHLHGVDSLLSIVQMPKGIPTATFAIGQAGAVNAGLFAAAMLAIHDPDLALRLAEFRRAQTLAVEQITLPEAQ